MNYREGALTRTGKRINIPLAAIICPVQQLTERYIPTGVDPPLESDSSVPSTLTGGRNTRYAFIH